MGTSNSEKRQPEPLYPLFTLPEQHREWCDGAVRAELARSAEEYWMSSVAETYGSFPTGSRFLEMLLSAIILAYPPDKNEVRSNAARLREAMNAILGRYERDDRNDHDDSGHLRELAWHANDQNFDERKLREITRKLIAGQSHDAEEESVKRRIVGKFKNEPESVSRALSDADDFRDELLYRVFRDVASLLASVGVRTAETATHSAPDAVNVEVPPSFSSDPDEHIP